MVKGSQYVPLVISTESTIILTHDEGAVVRDTILLDGGIMSFSRLLEGGGVGEPDVGM